MGITITSDLAEKESIIYGDNEYVEFSVNLEVSPDLLGKEVYCYVDIYDYYTNEKVSKAMRVYLEHKYGLTDYNNGVYLDFPVFGDDRNDIFTLENTSFRMFLYFKKLGYYKVHFCIDDTAKTQLVSTFIGTVKGINLYQPAKITGDYYSIDPTMEPCVFNYTIYSGMYKNKKGSLNLSFKTPEGDKLNLILNEDFTLAYKYDSTTDYTDLNSLEIPLDFSFKDNFKISLKVTPLKYLDMEITASLYVIENNTLFFIDDYKDRQIFGPIINVSRGGDLNGKDIPFTPTNPTAENKAVETWSFTLPNKAGKFYVSYEDDDTGYKVNNPHIEIDENGVLINGSELNKRISIPSGGSYLNKSVGELYLTVLSSSLSGNKISISLKIEIGNVFFGRKTGRYVNLCLFYVTENGKSTIPLYTGLNPYTSIEYTYYDGFPYGTYRNGLSTTRITPDASLLPNSINNNTSENLAKKDFTLFVFTPSYGALVRIATIKDILATSELYATKNSHFAENASNYHYLPINSDLTIYQDELTNYTLEKNSTIIRSLPFSIKTYRGTIVINSVTSDPTLGNNRLNVNCSYIADELDYLEYSTLERCKFTAIMPYIDHLNISKSEKEVYYATLFHDELEVIIKPQGGDAVIVGNDADNSITASFTLEDTTVKDANGNIILDGTYAPFQKNNSQSTEPLSPAIAKFSGSATFIEFKKGSVLILRGQIFDSNYYCFLFYYDFELQKFKMDDTRGTSKYKDRRVRITSYQVNSAEKTISFTGEVIGTPKDGTELKDYLSLHAYMVLRPGNYGTSATELIPTYNTGKFIVPRPSSYNYDYPSATNYTQDNSSISRLGGGVNYPLTYDLSLFDFDKFPGANYVHNVECPDIVTLEVLKGEDWIKVNKKEGKCNLYEEVTGKKYIDDKRFVVTWRVMPNENSISTPLHPESITTTIVSENLGLYPSFIQVFSQELKLNYGNDVYIPGISTDPIEPGIDLDIKEQNNTAKFKVITNNKVNYLKLVNGNNDNYLTYCINELGELTDSTAPLPIKFPLWVEAKNVKSEGRGRPFKIGDFTIERIYSEDNGKSYFIDCNITNNIISEIGRGCELVTFESSSETSLAFLERTLRFVDIYIPKKTSSKVEILGEILNPTYENVDILYLSDLPQGSDNPTDENKAVAKFTARVYHGNSDFYFTADTYCEPADTSWYNEVWTVIDKNGNYVNDYFFDGECFYEKAIGESLPYDLGYGGELDVYAEQGEGEWLGIINTFTAKLTNITHNSEEHTTDLEIEVTLNPEIGTKAAYFYLSERWIGSKIYFYTNDFNNDLVSFRIDIPLTIKPNRVGEVLPLFARINFGNQQTI